MDKFYSTGAEVNKPKCKTCKYCYDLMYCKKNGKIKKEILLNKEKCNYYSEK